MKRHFLLIKLLIIVATLNFCLPIKSYTNTLAVIRPTKQIKIKKKKGLEFFNNNSNYKLKKRIKRIVKKIKEKKVNTSIVIAGLVFVGLGLLLISLASNAIIYHRIYLLLFGFGGILGGILTVIMGLFLL